MQTTFTRDLVIGVIVIVLAAVGYYIYQAYVPGPFFSRDRTDSPLADAELVVPAFNDLGMHCLQPDYSKFMILPPGNNLRVQVFRKGDDAGVVMDGIKIKYKVTSQTDPTKYTNFWDYAGKYGYAVSPGVGITGNTLEGTFKPKREKHYWEADGIPAVGVPGGTGETSPYQTTTITVFDEKTGKKLSELKDVVVPVSTEMDCKNCHGEEDTWGDIVRKHDKAENTSLAADAARGNPHRCNECHADPILKEPGNEGVPSLSLAMHGFHADKMNNNVDPVCYNCHPGEQTDCNRGVMRAEGYQCDECHGTMQELAGSIKKGRTPWLHEATCAQCHKDKYGENKDMLYRDSYLRNGPAEEMNGLILCASCHNSAHAEWPSTRAVDNEIPKRYQGKPGPLADCNICHEKKSGLMHQ